MPRLDEGIPLPTGGERVPPQAAGEGRHLTQHALSAPPLIRVLRTHLLPAGGEKEPARGLQATTHPPLAWHLHAPWLPSTGSLN